MVLIKLQKLKTQKRFEVDRKIKILYFKDNYEDLYVYLEGLIRTGERWKTVRPTDNNCRYSNCR